MFYKSGHRFVYAALLSVLIVSTACTRTSANNTSLNGSSKTATVKRGVFQKAVRLNGTVGAVESFTVLAPRLSGAMMGSGTMVIMTLVPNGSTVRKGDVLVEFDRQAQLKNIQDRQAEYDGFVQQIRKKQADQASTKITDETDIKGAEVDLRTAQVEMHKNEIIPKYQAEINKASLAEAEAQLKQLKETFTLKRQAEAADIRILEIQRDRAQKALEYAKSNVDKMTVRSPMDGLVVLSSIYKGTRYVEPAEGDDVRPGAALMMVVNPSSMKVSARINQIDLSQLKAGESAEIRLDAYPDLIFPGKLERISAIAISNSDSKRIRHFSAIVSIQGKNPKLLPDLTASADIQLKKLENVLLIPREAIIIQRGEPSVEVLSNGKPELRTIKTGPMNNHEAVVESGLQEGAVISLNPKSALK